MPYFKFTDNEYAVIIDSLSMTRKAIRDKMTTDPAVGSPTPNIDSALAKFYSWADPAGCEFIAMTGSDMQLILGANDDPDCDERKYQAG